MAMWVHFDCSATVFQSHTVMQNRQGRLQLPSILLLRVLCRQPLAASEKYLRTEKRFVFSDSAFGRRIWISCKSSGCVEKKSSPPVSNCPERQKWKSVTVSVWRAVA